MGKEGKGENKGGAGGVECVRGRNVWNPNCVIAPEQTLVLPVIPQAAGTEQVCVLARETGRERIEKVEIRSSLGLRHTASATTHSPPQD